MSCIVLVGGLIGCGKTTLVNFFLDKQNELFQDSFSNEDNVRMEESSKLKQNRSYKILFDELCSIQEQTELMKTLKGWKNFRVDLLIAAEYFITSACELECQIPGPLSEHCQNLLNQLYKLNNPTNSSARGIFFVEDNFYYRSMRYEWFQIARRNNIGFCEVFVQCPLKMALYRNSTRGYNIPEQKIKMMLTCMEYPNPVKYKWEKYSLVFDSSSELICSTLTPIVKLIQEAADNPAELMINEEKIEAQKICSKNAVHQADNILRKLISKKILYFKKNVSEKEDLNSLILFTVAAKQELLNGIKNGEVSLPVNILNNLKESGIEKVHQEYEDTLNEIFESTLQSRMFDVNFLSATFSKTLNLMNGHTS